MKDEWSDTEGGNGMGLVRKRAGAGSGKKDGNLTEGPIGRGLFRFMIPIFLGQLLQQLYNMADAWVVGNFASNDAFAAVSLSSNVNMSVITFFAGIAVGGGVVISKYFGAQDEEKLRCAVHTNFLLGIVFSVFATLIGLFFVPILLGWLNTPDSVMVEARLYFGIYFAGVSTVIMYNICMNIMRAVGDSVHPLYYLIFSSIVNMILDLIFVAGFQWSAAGAAVATVIAQGLSVLLCMIRMVKDGGAATIHFKELRFNGSMIRQVITQGLPTGLQNSVISVGNLVVQSNINTFGAFAISGQGAFAKLEGIAFLPIMSMSMADNLCEPESRCRESGPREERFRDGCGVRNGDGGACRDLSFYLGSDPASDFCGCAGSDRIRNDPRKNGCLIFLSAGVLQLRDGSTPRCGKIHCPDVYDADLLVRYPRALRDDRDPDYSCLPDDLLSVPADVDAEFDHLYRVPASDGLGRAGLDLFSALIDHKCHDLKRLIKRIFDRVALTNLDDTDIARVDLGLGVIVVLEDSLSLENVVRLGVFHMLVESDAGVGRDDHVGVHGRVSHELILV